MPQQVIFKQEYGWHPARHLPVYWQFWIKLPNLPAPMKIVKFLLSIGYTASLLYLVFFAARRRHEYYHFVNLVPFRTIVNGYRQSNFAVRGELLNYFTNLFGNIALFVPYTFILVFWVRYRRRMAIVTSVCLLSCVIELTQYFFHIGVTDIDDVLLNTLGGWLSLEFFLAVQKRFFQPQNKFSKSNLPTR